jgi:hypothetical protein
VGARVSYAVKERDRNTEPAIAFCLAHPQRQLSLQTHKLTGFR